MLIDITLNKAKYRNPNKKLNVRDKIDPHCNLAASDLCPRDQQVERAVAAIQWYRPRAIHQRR